jgi:trehalose 6-phosphate phosphatase
MLEQSERRTMPERAIAIEDVSKLAILLDIDGTILDIAPTPREVFVPHALRETLARLSQRVQGALAFVSGRPVSEIDLIFSPLQLPAIGGHGAELRLVAGEAAAPPRLPPLDAKLKRRFAAIAEAGPGIILEDKGYSLALHYRLAPDKERIVHETAAKIAAAVGSGIELLPGKLVLEIKQSGVTKATAVRELMTQPPFQGRRPLFIGDDVTDFPVFDIIPEYRGIGISVGRKVVGVDNCMERPADVRRWLEQLSHQGAVAAS